MEADDYLAYSIVKEFADAEVETIGEIEGVIQAWIDKWAMTEKASSGGVKAKGDGESRASIGEGEEKKTTKFCTKCREVLPIKAKFCSACGEPQG